MKQTKIAFFFFVLFISCNRQSDNNRSLLLKVDSLQNKLDHAYRPGLGELMTGIQIHHAKLWFAGDAANWSLADFETKEIREAMEDIKTYCADRPEASLVMMLHPPLDSLDNAIHQKNIVRFKRGFILLTNTCNNCHRETKHDFNVIRIPLTPPFSNQVFLKQ